MLYCYHLYTVHIALEFLSRGIAFALGTAHSAFTAFPESHCATWYSQLWKLQRETWVCALWSVLSFLFVRAWRIIVVILAIHLGSFWKSYRCYRLKLGNFGAGPWAWCERVLLEPWTGVRARPGAAMQVCALCWCAHLGNFIQHELLC